MPTFLVPEEVRVIFRKKTTKTIYRWLWEGKFPDARKVRRNWLIPEVDVEKFLKTLDMEGHKGT